MKLFEILNKYNIISAIPFKGDRGLISNDLKHKIIASKIEYNQFKKEFDGKVEEFRKDFTDSTKEEINTELNKYVNDLLQEDKEVKKNFSLTTEEYDQMVDLIFDDITINGMKVPALEFLLVLYEEFCTKSSE